jgi:bifunctional oligoribonuclease and PAP phosphatase NrnA
MKREKALRKKTVPAKLLKALRAYDTFLITSHRNLEGDAVGSELALRSLLRRLGKTVTVVNEDPVPPECAFLPFASSAKVLRELSRPPRAECFISVDCADAGRYGKVSALAAQARCTINIDHHAGNPEFGDINWVDPHASCAAEMVYELFEALGVPVDRPAAEAIYVGIMTDTGSFRYRNTSARTHHIVAELLAHGIDMYETYRRIYERLSFEDVVSLGGMLTRIRRSCEGKCVWLALPPDKGRGSDMSDQVMALMRSIEKAKVVMLLRPRAGTPPAVRVNFRSQGDVDVSAVARAFGGGGHKAASGCTVPGRMPEVIRRVMARVEEGLR